MSRVWYWRSKVTRRRPVPTGISGGMESFPTHKGMAMNTWPWHPGTYPDYRQYQAKSPTAGEGSDGAVHSETVPVWRSTPYRYFIFDGESGCRRRQGRGVRARRVRGQWGFQTDRW